MNIKGTFFMLSLLSVLIASPQHAFGERIICESLGGDRHYCDMDTRGGVRVNRNLSKTDCTEGLNWGATPRGVWVDRGCRAEFISGSREYTYNEDYYRQPPPPSALDCPPGTHPSTHRCTDEERRRGCKDYGRPGGMGCSNF